MKTASKVLIYDNDCLLCETYTSAFVKTSLLPASGRQYFNTVDPEIFKLVDQQLCNNEIPNY
jgi:predicted DCC family thiol-disulfide oxidoreductase YuxK